MSLPKSLHERYFSQFCDKKSYLATLQCMAWHAGSLAQQARHRRQAGMAAREGARVGGRLSFRTKLRERVSACVEEGGGRSGRRKTTSRFIKQNRPNYFTLFNGRAAATARVFVCFFHRFCSPTFVSVLNCIVRI